MTRPILYDYWRSSAAYRVRIALNLKGVDYESRPVNLAGGEQRSEGYRAVNPQALIPTLEIDGQRLTQSIAICDYLDALVPEPPLLPKSPEGRAHGLMLALTVACDIHPLNNLRVLNYLRDPLDQEQDEVDRWYAHWITHGFAALETMAARQAGDFMFGDAPTLADVFLVPQMYNARRMNVPIDGYPTLRRADSNASALPAFANAHPDRHTPPE